MSAIYFLIPIAVGLVGFAIWLFFWAVDNGQYDDQQHDQNNFHDFRH